MCCLLTNKKFFPLHITHVNKILLSIFSDAELYINNHQIYNSNGLYAHKTHNSNNFDSTMIDNKGVLQWEWYDYAEGSENILKGHFSLEQWNCTVDLSISCCTVSWASTFLQHGNYYIQVWTYESD